MRILFYHTAREWTGSWRAVAALANGLGERGHSIAIACPPDGSVKPRLAGGAYELLPLDAEPSVSVAAGPLRRALRDLFIEVVCVHSNEEQVSAAMAARLAQRAAILRRVPVGEPLALDRRAHVALRLAATGFVFSAEEDAQSAPVLRAARLPSVVAPIGIQLIEAETSNQATRASLGIGGRTRILACVCNAGGRTRLAHVLRVVALLAPRHPELRLLLIGPGADDDELRIHAAALRIGKIVSFLGARDDARSIVALADLGWVVADGDDGAYATLDFLAARVPVLMEGGTLVERYVPDGIAGILLPPDDPHGAAAAVARLLAHEEQRVTMGGAGQARVARDYGESAMIDAFERAAITASDRSLW